MPNLPTLTVSQAHFDRIVAAFPGADGAAKTAAYQAWLTNRLIERVTFVEARRVEQEADIAKAAALSELANSLPARAQEPDLP